MDKENEEKITPLYETNPLVLGEETSKEAEELAVRLAKEWVLKNEL